MNDRPSWRDRAACYGSDVAPAAFFTIEVDPRNGRHLAEVRAARSLAASVCVTCPVRVACGSDAEAERLSDPADPNAVRPIGIRAGYFYDSSQRPPVKAAASSVQAQTTRLRPCGTRAAYKRHKAWDEEPCDACVEVERAYHAGAWQRKKEAAA